MVWKIEYRPRALRDLKTLDHTVRKRIQNYLKYQVAVAPDPKSLGIPMTGDKKGLWRFRVSRYRIVCTIHDEELVVLVVRIGHRKSIYSILR